MSAITEIQSSSMVTGEYAVRRNAPDVPSREAVFIVVAAFNEASMIEHVIRRLHRLYPNIVVVDDGSSDGTADRLHGLDVYVLRHFINRGQGAALQTGIRFALLQGAEVVVTFDADGQHSEHDIQSLVAPIRSGECDVTLGSRFLGRTEGMPLTRRMLLKAGVLFTRLVSRIRVSDVHNGLRAFSRAAASSLNITMERMAHASEILDQVKIKGWRYKEIPVDIHYSSYSLAKGQTSWNAISIGAQLLIRKLSI
jgi:glycosyltransferase involved in cell wall biosynthesis